VAVKIRLKRMGKIRTAIYRVVVMDSRTKRDGRAIEEIGKYDPNQNPSLVDIDMERADYWVAQGAQPTEAVAALLKLYKDGTLQVAEKKPSKKELYEAAVAAAGKSGDDESGATTPKKRAAKKAAEEPKGDDAKGNDAKAEVPAENAEQAEQAAEFADLTPDAAKAAAEDGATDEVTSPAEATPATETTEAAAAEAELPKGAAAPLEGGEAPEGYTIKGNKDSMKFHEPDGQWYDQTIAEVCFKTAADAEAAGFTKAGA
jgi:small subunit ribosomal protein S16